MAEKGDTYADGSSKTDDYANTARDDRFDNSNICFGAERMITAVDAKCSALTVGDQPRKRHGT